MLTVWAVDPGRVRRGHLVVLEASAVLRDMDVGTWTLKAAADDMGTRVSYGWSVMIVDDGETILSGPVTELGTDEPGESVTLTGVTDMQVLADRVVYPDPSQPVPVRGSEAYYVQKGVAESILRDLARLNAGPGAITDRRTAGFDVVASEGRGGTVSTNLRFKPLLESMRTLGRSGGVTFDVIREQDMVARLRFRVPSDRSRRVRFTRANGGFVSGSYSITGPTVTTVFVAGQGVGSERRIETHNRNPGPWGRRIESFQDRRDTDDDDELAQAGEDTLTEGEPKATAAVEVGEAPGLRFGTDYRLGDTVLVDFGPTTIMEPVRSAEIAWDGFGRTVKLSLGDYDADDNEPALFDFVRKLDTRVRGLETI